MVSETLTGLDGSAQQTLHDYKYDAAGNLMGYQMDGQGFTNTYTNSYVRFGGYKQLAQAGNSTASDPGETDYKYDVEGNLIGVVDQKAEVNDRQFANDIAGRVLEKISFSQDSSGHRVTHRERGMIVNGEDFGISGDDTTEAIRGGVDGTRTDGAFDLAWKQISSGYPGAAPGAYTVAAGDTLQSIAKGAYGDASQWYRIAEANGLNLNSTLTAGQVLKLPPTVNASNNASTNNPYDPMSHIGDTNPTMPAPDAGGCGTVGMIVMLIVVVVASIFTAGAAAVMMAGVEGATVGGIMSAGAAVMTGSTIAGVSVGGSLVAGSMAAAAVGGAVGSAVGQGIAMASGMQSKFSWGQVGLGALTAAVGSGVGNAVGAGQEMQFASTTDALTGTTSLGLVGTSTGAASTATSSEQIMSGIGKAAVRGTASSAITRELQGKWSWRNIAASAVGSMAGYAAGQAGATAVDSSASTFTRNLAAGTTAGIAQNVTMQSFHGGKLKLDNIAADAFGNAFGNAIAESGLATDQQQKQADAQYSQASGGARLGDSTQPISWPSGWSSVSDSAQIDAERANLDSVTAVPPTGADVSVSVLGGYDPGAVKRAGYPAFAQFLDTPTDRSGESIPAGTWGAAEGKPVEQIVVIGKRTHNWFDGVLSVWDKLSDAASLPDYSNWSTAELTRHFSEFGARTELSDRARVSQGKPTFSSVMVSFGTMSASAGLGGVGGGVVYSGLRALGVSTVTSGASAGMTASLIGQGVDNVTYQATGGRYGRSGLDVSEAAFGAVLGGGASVAASAVVGAGRAFNAVGKVVSQEIGATLAPYTAVGRSIGGETAVVTNSANTTSAVGTLGRVESRFGSAPREVGFIVDAESGNLLTVARQPYGQANSSFRFSPEQWSMAEGNWITHNHPSGLTLGIEDMAGAVSSGARGIRASTAAGTYELSFDSSFASAYRGDYGATFGFLHTETNVVGRGIMADIRSGALTVPEGLQGTQYKGFLANEMWVRYANQNPGLQYSFIPRKLP